MPKEEQVMNDQTVRLAQRNACAALALARTYIAGTRRPIPHEECVRIVAPYGTQPNLVLHLLEREGVLPSDSARGKNRARIVDLDRGVTAMVNKVVVRFWPDPEPAAEEALVRLAKVPAASRPKPSEAMPAEPLATEVVPRVRRARAPREEQAQKLCALLIERIGDAEFSVADVERVSGLPNSTTNGYLRRLVATGGVELLNEGVAKRGTKGRYRVRIAPAAAPTEELSAPASEPAQQSVIRSRGEIESGVRTKREMLGQMDERKRRFAELVSQEPERRRKVEEARQILAEAEAVLARTVAELDGLWDRTSNELDAERLRQDIAGDEYLLEGYEDIVARLVAHH